MELKLYLEDGGIRTLSVDDDCVGLSLSHLGIESVDLSPLSRIESLEMLSLYSNYLTQVDLNPLAKCRNLRSLSLSINNITSLDLSPLASCQNLEALDVGPNELSEIDFSPLSRLAGLKKLRIDGNKVSKLDLAPLAGMTNLHFLDLSMNELRTIDLWPLASCMSIKRLLLDGNWLNSIDISPLVLIGSPLMVQKDTGANIVIHPDLEISGNGLHSPSADAFEQFEISKDIWTKFRHSVLKLSSSFSRDQEMRFQRVFLKLLRIDEIGIYDGPLEHIISAIPEDADFSTTRARIYDRMIELVGKQLATDGPTLFMDVDRLSVTRGSKLVPSILERREDEIRGVKIPIFNGEANLVPLWLTSYGHAVLKSLGIQDYQVNKSKIRRIRSALKEVGYKLSTTRVNSPEATFKSNPLGSTELRNYIVQSDSSIMENQVEFRSASRVFITPAVGYAGSS
ncbi:MAG: leucine-rich repeat domain-containing protein [Candidatus Thorarchaeota archaeon]